jgi:hypothetical protein
MSEKIMRLDKLLTTLVEGDEDKDEAWQVLLETTPSKGFMAKYELFVWGQFLAVKYGESAKWYALVQSVAEEKLRALKRVVAWAQLKSVEDEEGVDVLRHIGEWESVMDLVKVIATGAGLDDTQVSVSVDPDTDTIEGHGDDEHGESMWETDDAKGTASLSYSTKVLGKGSADSVVSDVDSGGDVRGRVSAAKVSIPLPTLTNTPGAGWSYYEALKRFASPEAANMTAATVAILMEQSGFEDGDDKREFVLGLRELPKGEQVGWDQIKELLRPMMDRLDEPYKRELRGRVNVFKQHKGEGARAYGRRFRSLLLDLKHYGKEVLVGESPEEVFEFVVGRLLPKSHYTPVARWPGVDWAAAIAHLEDLENKGALPAPAGDREGGGVHLVGASAATGTSITCFNCGKPGHVSRDCAEADTGMKHFSGKCFNCGKQGHMANKCRAPSKERQQKKGKVCFGCGEEGHFARECPTKGASGDGKRVRFAGGVSGLGTVGVGAAALSSRAEGGSVSQAAYAADGVMAVLRRPQPIEGHVLLLEEDEVRGRVCKASTHVQVRLPEDRGVGAFQHVQGAMIDSGSVANLVGGLWVARNGLERYVDTSQARSFGTANKQAGPLRAKGVILLPINVRGMERVMPFYVADIPVPSLILGRPAVRELGMVLDLRYGRVYFRNGAGFMVSWHALERERGNE